MINPAQTVYGMPPTYEAAVGPDVEATVRAIGRLLEDKAAPVRKSILERAIRIHNEGTFNEADKIALNQQDGFPASYPRLHKWIEDNLRSIDRTKIGEFAFACGHFDLFRQATDNYPTNSKKLCIDYFQRYFLQEGTDGGVTQLLRLMGSNRILYPDQMEALLDAVGNLDVECITVNNNALSGARFPYDLVHKVIVGDNPHDYIFLRALVGDNSILKEIQDKYPRNTQLVLMDCLDRFANSGGRAGELSTHLEHCRRRDLAEELTKALKNMDSAIHGSAGNPKRFKY